MGDCSDWARAPEPVRYRYKDSVSGYVSPPLAHPLPSGGCPACFQSLDFIRLCPECEGQEAALALDRVAACVLISFAAGCLLGICMGALM